MRNEKLLTLLMLSSMCIWGISWSSAKILAAYSNPFTMAFIRVFITFIAYIPVILLTKQSFKVKSKGKYLALGAGIMLTFYALLFFKGLSIGKSGQGGVMVTILSPLFAYLITSTLKKQLPGKMELIGLGLGIIAGIILLQVWKDSQPILASGAIFFLLAGFTWAMMGVFSSYSRAYATIVPFSWWMHLVTLLGLSCFVDFNDLVLTLKNGDKVFWVNALYLGIINSTVATTIYLYATSKIGADKAGSFMFIVPATAVFFAWLIMGETLETHTLLGGILGILAVLIINSKMSKRKNLNQKHQTHLQKPGQTSQL